MPIIPGLITTFDKLKVLHRDKNDDYAPEGKPFFNFDIQEFGISLFNYGRDKVFAGMIFLKLSRLSVLLNKSGPPKNESIEDSFDDAITYMAIWKADYQDRNKVKQRLSDVSIEMANKV